MIGPHECHVWWARPHPGMDTRRGWLTADEQARARRYRRGGDRLRFVTGRVVLRSVLGAWLDTPPSRVPLDATCGRCGAPHGKPRLDASGPPLELSIAHGGGRVAVAVSRGAEVGVDVEAVPPRPPAPAVIASVLAPCERLALAARPASQRAWTFARYWTRKEAVLKADGRGVAAGPASLVVTSPARPPRLLACGVDPSLPGVVGLCDLDPEGTYAASLAVASQTPPTVHQRWWEARSRERAAGEPAYAVSMISASP